MKKILLAFGLIMLCLSCGQEEQHPCYNANLIDNTAVCPTDCPGICGCDGVQYCNECEANKNGMSTTTAPPCK